MIIKTTKFVEKFFDDLEKIVFYSKNYILIKTTFFNKVRDLTYEGDQSYEEIMNEELDNRNNFVDPRYKDKKASPIFNFVGSFATKEFGKIMSDIDINQSPNFRSDGIMIRLREIIDKTNPSTKSRSMPFSFIRFYLGTIEGFEPPWSFNQFGNCEFDLDMVGSWLEKIKEIVPVDVYDFIYDKLNRDTLSLRDLAEIDDKVRKYTSITWLNEDVIKGYIYRNGKRYDLREMLTSTTSKIVVKFIYEYNNEMGRDTQNLRKDYLLVDLSLNQTRGDLISLNYYYLDNTSYKFKSLKRYLPADLVKTYRDDFVKNAGYLTTVGTRLDLLDKIERYNANEQIMSYREFQYLREDLNKFAIEHGYLELDPDFQSKSIKDMDKVVQSIISKIREELFDIYKNQVVNRKDEFYYYLLRGEEANIQISKDIISERLSNGISCPFFFLSGENLKDLIKLGLEFSFDPLRLVYCINNLANMTGFDSSDIFNHLNRLSFSLVKNDDETYNLYENKPLIISDSVDDLNAVLNEAGFNIMYQKEGKNLGMYTLTYEDKVVSKEIKIKMANNFLKDKGLYINYNPFGQYKYELFEWQQLVGHNLSVEQAQQMFIVKLMKR